MTTPTADRLADLTADCDLFACEQSAMHFGDRSSHYVIATNGAIVMESPETEDDNGNRRPATRILVEAGVSNLDREYHLRSGHKQTAYAARNLVCFGF